MRVVQKTPEIEYVHYALQIVNHALKVSDLRHAICSEDLRSAADIGDTASAKLTYSVFLKTVVEK